MRYQLIFFILCLLHFYLSAMELNPYQHPVKTVLQSKDLFNQIALQLISLKKEKWGAEKYDWRLTRQGIHKKINNLTVNKTFLNLVSQFKKSTLMFDLEKQFIAPKTEYKLIAKTEVDRNCFYAYRTNLLIENPQSINQVSKEILCCAHSASEPALEYLKKVALNYSYQDLKYALNPGYLDRAITRRWNEYVTNNIKTTIEKFPLKTQEVLVLLLKEKIQKELVRKSDSFLETDLKSLEAYVIPRE